MAGLLAIYAFDDLWVMSTYVKYGLMSLQHRGSENFTLCITNNGVKCYSSNNIDDISEHALSNKVIAVAHSNNNEILYQEKVADIDIALIAERPHKLFSEIARDLGKSLNRGMQEIKNSLERFSDIIDIPSFLAIFGNGDIVAWRSTNGLTPMVLGGYGFDMAMVSSESTAVDILGGDIRRHIEPGEGIYLSRHLVKKFKTSLTIKPMLCLFELLYLARHDAIIDGVNVYEFRKKLGEELAKTSNRDIDVVVGVPETAIPYAIGFAKIVNKPFDLAFITTGGRVRSMLRTDPREKLIAIHLKMNPIRCSIEGKKIALVDDSMVTGSTIKTISQVLRYRIGVEELHLLIASPPLVRTCPYNVMKLDMEKLLAANLTKDMAIKYLEVDSLSWLNPVDIENITRLYKLKLCGKCFGIDIFGESK